MSDTFLSTEWFRCVQRGSIINTADIRIASVLCILFVSRDIYSIYFFFTMIMQTFLTRMLTACMILVAFVGGQAVNAQEVAEVEEELIDFTIVAQVAVYDATVVQDGDILSASFTVSNAAEEVQSDIRYGIELWTVSADPLKDSTRVFVAVADDTFGLDGESSIVKTITTQLPDGLSGLYTVRVVAETVSGMPLDSSTAGTVRLSGTGVMIDQSTCYAHVSGDDTKYETLHGVDVVEEEELLLSCLVTNQGADTTMTPVYATTERSLYGPTVGTTYGSPVVVRQGTHEMTFAIPTPSIPQAYDTVIFLSDDLQVSSPASVHYVVQGTSATVQNVTLDKASYKEGDTAVASIFVSGVAGAFTGARNTTSTLSNPVLVAVLKDRVGASCADTRTFPLDDLETSDVTVEDITFTVTRDCSGATVAFSLSDDSGLLAEGVATTESGAGTASLSWAALVILVVIGGIIVFVVTRANVKVGTAVMIVLLAGSLGVGITFASSSGTSSEKVTNTKNANAPSSFTGVAKFETVTVTVHGGLDKKEYTPYENVTIDASLKVALCANDWLDSSITWDIDELGQVEEFYYQRCLAENEMDLCAQGSKPSSTWSRTTSSKLGSSSFSVICERVEANGGERCVATGGEGVKSAPAEDGDHTAYVYFEGKHGEFFYTGDVRYSVKKTLKVSGELPFEVVKSSEPEVFLTANPGVVYEGDNAVLGWNTLNVTSCLATSEPVASGWDGNVSQANGNTASGALTEDVYVFTLTCLDMSSQPVSAIATVYTEERQLPVCSDTIDNDGDGWADDEDPGCYVDGVYDPSGDSEVNTGHACSDSDDNDGDGQTDGYDPGCDDGFDDDEFNEISIPSEDDSDDGSGDGDGDGSGNVSGDGDGDPDDIDFSEF